MKYTHFLIILIGIQLSMIATCMGSYNSNNDYNPEYSEEEIGSNKLGKRLSKIEKKFNQLHGGSDNELQKNKNKDEDDLHQFQGMSEIVLRLCEQNRSLVNAVSSSNNKIFYYNVIITTGLFVFMYYMFLNSSINISSKMPIHTLLHSTVQQ